MRWPWKRLRQKACQCHDYEKGRNIDATRLRFKSTRLLGATLSWGAKPVPYEESEIECLKCERTFKRRGYLPDALWQRNYPPDTDGWPLHNGERMKIWQLNGGYYA